MAEIRYMPMALDPEQDELRARAVYRRFVYLALACLLVGAIVFLAGDRLDFAPVWVAAAGFVLVLTIGGLISLAIHMLGPGVNALEAVRQAAHDRKLEIIQAEAEAALALERTRGDLNLRMLAVGDSVWARELVQQAVPRPADLTAPVVAQPPALRDTYVMPDGRVCRLDLADLAAHTMDWTRAGLRAAGGVFTNGEDTAVRDLFVSLGVTMKPEAIAVVSRLRHGLAPLPAISSPSRAQIPA